MKIIVEKATNDVLFLAEDLKLDENGVKGKKFTASNIKPDNHELIEISGQVPKPFAGRFFNYIGGELVLKAEKETEYNRIKNPVPTEITLRQFRLALLEKDLLPAIKTAIDLLTPKQKAIAQIELDYSHIMKRDNPFIATLGSLAGLTEDQIDDLFVDAEKL